MENEHGVCMFFQGEKDEHDADRLVIFAADEKNRIAAELKV